MVPNKISSLIYLIFFYITLARYILYIGIQDIFFFRYRNIGMEIGI